MARGYLNRLGLTAERVHSASLQPRRPVNAYTGQATWAVIWRVVEIEYLGGADSR